MKKIINNYMDKSWPDALVCNKCGKVVERGIANVSEHYVKCGSMDLSHLNDAEFEVIQPKQLPNSEQNDAVSDTTKN